MDLRATISRLVTITPIRRSLIAFAFFGFVWQGAINFVPVYLELERGFDPTIANVVFAALFLLAMVANPVAGALGDHFSGPTVAAGGLLVGMVGLAGTVAGGPKVLTTAGVLLLGTSLSTFWPVMDAFVMSRLPNDTVGGDFGALNTANLAVGSLGPVYVGLVAERLDYATAYATLSVGLLATLVVLLRMKRDADGR